MPEKCIISLTLQTQKLQLRNVTQGHIASMERARIPASAIVFCLTVLTPYLISALCKGKWHDAMGKDPFPEL
jgi:hypothetical protein